MRSSAKYWRNVGHCMAIAMALWGAPAAAASVAVVGLFKDKAMVSVDGGPPRLMSVSGGAVEGIRLISADSDHAVLEVDGAPRTLRMGQSFAGQAATSGEPTVHLTADARGSFSTTGYVNGSAVTFIVDTGASSVAITADEARRAGIDYKATGQPTLIATAAGANRGWAVTLDKVRVGGITLYQVPGVVVEQGLPVGLLGMSFLSRTGMKREGSSMTLTKRY